LRRRCVLAAALACGGPGRASPQPGARSAASSGAPPLDELAARVAEAEAALARGDAVLASERFERAGAMRHAADSEMGLVRAAMQLGDYRRALAFCAHVAGEHLDAPGAAVLYAWLLQAGGRRELADRVLREALERAPGNALVADSMRALAAATPVASDAALATPHRVAPFATSAPGERVPPASARVVSSGVLLPGGRQALVPGRPEGSRVWVRAGLGATREAALESGDGAAVTLWRLASPIDSGDRAVVAGDAVAGTPVFAFEYAEALPAMPAWPWLRAGFLGAAAADGSFRIGVEFTAPRAGGPVLDRAGRLVGIVVRDGHGRLTMRAASPRADASVEGAPASATDPAAPRARGPDLAPDLIYERGLRAALQVIAAA
jgi:hypothetical protein